MHLELLRLNRKNLPILLIKLIGGLNFILFSYLIYFTVLEIHVKVICFHTSYVLHILLLTKINRLLFLILFRVLFIRILWSLVSWVVECLWEIPSFSWSCSSNSFSWLRKLIRIPGKFCSSFSFYSFINLLINYRDLFGIIKPRKCEILWYLGVFKP